MSDWRYKILVVFCPLLLLLYFYVSENKKAEVSHRTSRSIASSTTPVKKAVVDSPKEQRRTIAQEQKLPKNNFLLNRIPQSIEETFEKNSNFKMTPGFELVENVAALPEDRFKPSLGSIVQKRDGMVYFRADPGHPYIPVALSRTTNMLYPISSILHVKKATQEIRKDLLKRGFKQYYYHPSLKLLSIESKSGHVIKTYQELLRDGYKVELEVLRPSHQKI